MPEPNPHHFRRMSVKEIDTYCVRPGYPELFDLKVYAYFANTAGSVDECWLLPIKVLQYADQTFLVRPADALSEYPGDESRAVWVAVKDVWIQV